MKKNVFHIAFATAMLGLLAGCATSHPEKKNGVRVSPAPYVLMPDSIGQVKMDLRFHVPANSFSRRSRLVILPQLVVGDSVNDEYAPVVLDASIYSKKKKRLQVLEGYVDPYAGQAVAVDHKSRVMEVPYQETVRLPFGADNARIVGIVSTDGCGECTGIDTIDIAAVSNPVTLLSDVKESLKLTWMEPEFKIRPKVMEGKGVAHLQFIINRYDINLSLGRNKQELEDMVNTLAPILQDTLATLTSLKIYGMASADGSLSFNTPLSRNRAESAKNWLVRRLGIRPEIQRIIKVGSRPEGWQPVLDAMIADGHPDSTAVKAILEKYADSNDDVQERYIRRLPSWKQIRERYLQKDRKVEYEYSYSLKSFTSDKELLEMYGKRPEAFNEEELLRVATLVSYDKKKDVYRTILRYFPQSKVAVNNLAVLYLREDNEEEARRVIEESSLYTPETLHLLACSYIYENDYERAIELLQQVELPEARYNLGLLKARQRKLKEAYDLLRPFGDVNSAVCALSVNENNEAKRILAGMENDRRPIVEYVRSMAAARLKDNKSFYEHIGPACVDEKLRNRAATEPDFYPYHEEEMFRRVVNLTKKDE